LGFFKESKEKGYTKKGYYFLASQFPAAVLSKQQFVIQHPLSTHSHLK